MKTLICKYCNKSFKTYDGKRKFCSRYCSNKHRWKNGSIGLKKTGEAKKCLWCGNQIYAKPSLIDSKKYCSRSCLNLYRYHIEQEGNLVPFKKTVNRKKNKYKKSNGAHIHRTVAEQKIGRKILPSEEVHHIDGNHLNNSPNNLQVMSRTDHRRLHAKLRLAAQQ